MRNVTDVFVKTNTVSPGAGGRLNRGIHKNEYCLAGTGGRLNCVCNLDVAGTWIVTGLWICRGPNRKLLQFGPWVWKSNWAQAQLIFTCFSENAPGSSAIFFDFFFSFLIYICMRAWYFNIKNSYFCGLLKLCSLFISSPL